MKKKKKIFYEEEIYSPCEFRTQKGVAGYGVEYESGQVELHATPVLLMGWVQDEVHLSYHWQSLQ